MTRRERLMATLQGQPVDRPAVSFYEIGGWRMDPSEDDFTVWNDPSWRPLVQLAHEETDLIRMVSPQRTGDSGDGLSALADHQRWLEGDSRFERTEIRTPSRSLTALTRRDRATQTVWTVEHLLKDLADVEAYLQLPEATPGTVDVASMLAEEELLGDTGIVSVDVSDALCQAAGLFSMEDYTVVAMTEPRLFHRLLERFARQVMRECEQICEVFPGRLWRIYGSEYASEPYLPPGLYREYVLRYTGQIIKTIQKHGGFARIHSHGRLRNILPVIAEMRSDALDPLEPPPQGDMELWEIKQAVGQEIVLMGNIEVADIEHLRPAEFEQKVVRALREGMSGTGRGFVLHPSACPYGRSIGAQTMANYETMLRLARDFSG